MNDNNSKVSINEYYIEINEEGLDNGAYHGTVIIPDYDYFNSISIKLISPLNDMFIEEILNQEELEEEGYTIDSAFHTITLPSEEKPKELFISLKVGYSGDSKECILVINILKGVPSYAIDLQSPAREALDLKTQTFLSLKNPICLGLETDNNSNKLIFVFRGSNSINGCQCMVSLEAANGNKSIQEIKQIDCSNGAFYPNNTIKENVTEIVLNWKPNNFLMQEKGLVKFAFQFYKLNGNGEYDFVLNTAPIYGYVHEGINAMQGIGSNIYPSEIADLYSKYNSLLSDKDITDLDSFEDVKLYLQTLVPFNIGADIPTTGAPDNSKRTWYILAYNPGQKRYGYVPAAMLDKEVIHGQVWNAGTYTGVELQNLPTKDPELN